MEMSLSLQFSCKTFFPNRGGCFNLTPFSGLTPSSWGKASRGLSCVNASADFSRKRQHKKGKSKRSGPKGFVPNSSIGSSSKKNARVKKGEQTLDINVDDDKDGEVEFPLEEKRVVLDNKTNEIAREFGELSLRDETLDVVESNRGEEIENIATVDEVVDDVKLHEEGTSYIGDDENVKDSEVTSAATDDRINEEASHMLKLKLEENLRKQEIERIADESFLRGTQMFVYPPVVKPDQEIDVFLNKTLSTLRDEEDILILGAFNDWRWKSFTVRLNKADLKDNWWSCRLYVPIEAYKLDFVFFNGQSVYDNNDQKDFCIPVNGGMDVLAFEEFLLEEKRKELEKLAKEEAERERIAEEQRRIEADKAAKEEDRLQARLEVERRQEAVLQLMKNAVKSNDDVWYIEPSEFKGNDLVRLYYNGSSGPLEHANEIWIHGGHNNWKDGLSIVERLVKSALKGGGAWWYAEVVVPDQALVLDWVFADGPPQNAVVYDNNHMQDFHAIVPMATPDAQYWVEEEELIYQKLQEERRLREEAIHAKAEKTALMKAETKEKTLKSFLLSQKHIVFTEPLDVQAGSTVTVFYNPSNTNLNGKPEVWFRGSFNRWSHRNGPLPPQRMLPAENGTHVKVSVKVPLDAYMMDFVFSESEHGGVFDNKFGMDYHIPVFGSIVKEPPLHIIHIAVEMAPIAKSIVRYSGGAEQQHAAMRRLVAEQLAMAAPAGISRFYVFMEHEALFTSETAGSAPLHGLYF
ncbi:soluble starch synthase 3 chloroplastic/amyloplastic-like [Trifolium pratense]|uniref:starch synthase n=1 Tax=Trifolium pratense TaxID=57577 RepID=A0A2K3NZ34_TRIPR|nr:soluble starch synthase 3 chloroplastic/amyloplastic-like [Trifolium pratense]